MNEVHYKYPELNIIGIIGQWTKREWMQVILKCEIGNDIERLVAIRYGIQRGMTSAAKVGIGKDEKFCIQFIRMTRSIELCAKRIIRRKNPSPLDDGKINLNDISREDMIKHHKAKRARDEAFNDFMRRSSF